MMKKEGIAWLSSTHKSIEEIATTILRDPYTNKPYVQFYATRRVGGQVLDSDAIKLLKIST
jgi:HK97 family phage major capsid protein